MKTKIVPHLALNSFIISILIFILIPLNLISNNIQDFNGLSYKEYFSYGAIFTIFSSLVIFLCSYMISLVSVKTSRKILTAIFGYLVICGFYLSLRSGLLDGVDSLSISYLRFSLVLIFILLEPYFLKENSEFLSGLSSLSPY